ncbi:MAG TPA: hypothetical protein VL020_02270, partial [Pseudomonadales bacterium]|nr:hypothetical protein [Pseudomonadales bacterium]
LCERAQYRITDLKRISFMMPNIFKDNCSDEYKYTIFVQEDYLGTSIPGRFLSGNKIIIGGTLGFGITARDYKKKWLYYSNPERMLEDYASVVYSAWPWYMLATDYSWVERADMRCLRLPVESDNGILRSRRMDYFCYESISGYPYPIHLHAWERLPTGSTGGTDFEKVLIEPILDSMQINPADPQILAQYQSKREQMCRDAKLFYDTYGMQGKGLGGGAHMRRTIRYLQDCGHEIAYLPEIKRLYDLITIKGKVIGQAGQQEHLGVFEDFSYKNQNTYSNYGRGNFTKDVRLLSGHEFKELKQTLLALRPRSIDTPFHYPGTWYGLAPSYEKRSSDGFGIRQHPKYGTVIDMTDLVLGHARISFIIDQ